MFYKIFCDLCEMRNIPKTKVLADIGLSTGNLNKWKKGGSINSDTIIDIANYFNVSIDYILTGKDFEGSLNEKEIELLNLIRKLPTDHEKSKFIGKAEEILKEMMENKIKTKTS